MTLTDKYAYASKLARVSPQAKMLFALVPLLLCILLNSIALSTAVIIIMAVATVRYGEMPLYRYIKFILLPLGFMLMGTLTILINSFQEGHAVLAGVQAGGRVYGIDAASLAACARLVLKALGAVSCMYFLALNTPLSDVFQVLGRTRLPQFIITLMELIYRYIFVLLEEAGRMLIAKDSRLGNISFRVSLQSLGELASMLFIRAYQRAGRLYAGLEARGYNGRFNTLELEYVKSGKMIAAAILISTLLLGMGLAEKLLV